MLDDVLKELIRRQPPANALEQENLLLEFLQQFILASLARTRFFQEAGFLGGTCLRIVHGLDRFSEDLDFTLKQPSVDFSWQPQIDRISHDFAAEGLELEAAEPVRGEGSVKKVMLKTTSFGDTSSGTLPFARRPGMKLKVRLEVDTNPPAGSGFETRYLEFPTLCALTAQTLESGFALKVHALLCRTYVKGRDWYDFLWYVARQVPPDLPLLANALEQQGPWADSAPAVDRTWVIRELDRRVDGIDWAAARDDVARFVPTSGQEGLRLWGRELFRQRVDKLARYLEAR